MQQQSMQQKPTIEQRIAGIANLALYPAIPVIVLIRRKPGFRFLNPAKLFVMFLLLNALSVFGYTSGGATPAVALLQLFAWGTLIMGLVKRQLRWRDIKNGVSWHTQSRGISSLSFLPVSDSNLKRWAEPIAVIVIGLLLAVPFTFFGYYLIFAGLCLFYFEAWDYEQSLAMMLDQLDSLVDSEVMDGNVQYYSQDNVSQRPLEQTAGIPTGIAPDIEVQIQRRRRGAGTNTGTLPGNVVTPATPTGTTQGTVI